ncbi:MAG: carboxypeptidase regulatory-like domain-containing protein [Woeseiaceae bacterium]|nr:carboxypeptidase regulatory-like domain-containing protein [Woeseiaceae bacterium]
MGTRRQPRNRGIATILCAGLLQACLAAPVLAESLRGTVRSQSEGRMEGVLVSSKREGSTITTTVVSDADGVYEFPGDRLAPGRHEITVRAVGFTLPSTTVEIRPGTTAKLDLNLDAVTSKLELGRQLSNTEWMLSAGEGGIRLGRCVNCHTLEPVMFSRYNAREMARVVQRMAYHTNKSSFAHPWFDTDVAEQLNKPPAKAHIERANYIASVNLSGRDVWPFELETLPRPSGEDTKVIYTTYDLPRPDAAPHDEVVDADGNVWYSDFNTPFFGVLDPRTGKVRDYEVPLRRPAGVAQGGLQIDIDPEGRIWYSTMEQLQIVRFDPETGTMDVYDLPVAEEDAADAHTTMIDPTRMDVDGNVWFNVAGGGEKGGEGSWRLHVTTGEFTRVRYPDGSPSARAYDVIADSENNLWGHHHSLHNIWTTNAKTLETEWFPFPDDRVGCRRGHMDSQDRLWCADFNGNGLVMFDTTSRRFEGNWTAPIAHTRPYDAHYDEKGYLWSGGMDADLIIRLDVETGRMNQYLLPRRTNIRGVYMQPRGADQLSVLWIGDQHGATITRVEPLGR